MQYQQLGNSDLKISRLGFGCEPLGGTDWGQVDDKQIAQAIAKALELGINFFDTADVYGLGLSESKLAKLLGPKRHDVIIATKFGIKWQSRKNNRAVTSKDASPKYLQQAVEDSLRRLQLECIPLYQIHWPDPKTPIADTMAALVRLQQQGKIRHIGCSNFTAELIQQAKQVAEIVSVQSPYNLIEQSAATTLMPLCQQLKISLLSYGPLAQGLLTGKYDVSSVFAKNDRRSRLAHFQPQALAAHSELFKKLKTLADKYQKPISQIALRWVLENPGITSAITGIKTVEQITNNVEVTNWQLQSEDFESLFCDHQRLSEQIT